MTQKIRGIFGDEPRRENEYPIAHIVGFDGVTEITMTTENMGDYGITWLHVWKDSVEVSRMNAKYVASIDFFPPEVLAS